MASDLYYTIPKYFEDRMAEHSNVESCTRLNVPDEYVYEIRRRKQRDVVKVWLSDAYRFTELDYHNRPKILKGGDYILIAKPEGGGGVTGELVNNARIGVGKLGEFMGALTSAQMWTYRPPTNEERRARRERNKGRFPSR